MNYTTPHEFGCYLQTQWGALKVRITEPGLTGISFEDGLRPATTHDSVFRTAFLNWLQGFQALSSEAQWNSLAPKGTDFQKKVWHALLSIPFGKQVNYKDIAKQIGQTGASRAVGSAIAANPIALLIPCHRVVPTSGGIGNYHWGSDRKLALIEAEQVSGSSVYQLFQ